MILKVVLVESGFIVVYASGRTKIYSCPYKKLPKNIKRFIDCHEHYAEAYADLLIAIVWR